MKFKRLFAIMFVVLIYINSSGVTMTFAAEQNDVTAYEFANALQQFASDNTSNIIDSIFPEPMNRLIVKTDSNEPLSNTYGAIASLEGFDGLHILQYETEEDAENAFAAFQEEKIKYVEFDYWINVDVERPKICNCEDNPGQKHGICACSGSVGFCDCPDNSSENHLSWNSNAVNVDQAFELIVNSKIECEPVTVAILDTGLYAEHEYFDSNRIAIDEDYCLEIDEVKYPSNIDSNYHGTHVAGTVYDNTMSNVKIAPYRIFGKSVSELPYSVLNGAIKAVISSNNVDVISMSIGMYPYDVESENLWLYETLSEAVRKNIVVVVAAGNDSDDSNNYIPASFTDAIVVSATKKGDVADMSYSNYGSGVDIGAPGTDIYSTTPLIEAKEDSDGNEVYISYMRTSGTSMATPLVAAAAATLKSIDPHLTPAEVERIIKETAYTPKDWDTNYGTGIVNFYNMVKAVLEPKYSATPTISINSDNKFEITAPEGTDSKIYYTLDGTVPSIDNHLIYTEPLNLRNVYSTRITAVCHENGKLIGETIEYNMITYDTKTIFCRWSASLTDENEAKNANWQSYNPEIVSVDKNGKITGKSKGTTNITCRLQTGERIIYKVNVKYSPLQAFFVLFFFGFLWI